MENTKEVKQTTPVNETNDEIVKEVQQTVLSEENQLQQKNLQQNLQEQQEVKQQIETLSEKPHQQQQQQLQPPQPQIIDYEQDGDDEDEDDDDEEKETSQKLVIDIPDEEEEEEKDEEEDDESEDVVAINEQPPQEVLPKKETEKMSPKPEKVETAVITLSDAEEDVTNDETVAKPAKVQKRRSMGAGAENEDHLRLKRRKINVAGAPKLPLTGYLRYLNDRRETVRKQHPTKTHTEHNKMIGEEWHALPADVKNSYLKAADVEKQRYVKELQSFLKSRPDILASELAKNKIRKTAENNSPNPAAATSTSGTNSVLKDKTQVSESSKTAKDNIKEKVAKEIVSIASTSHHASDKLNNEKNKRKRTPTPPSSTTNATSSTGVSASASASSLVTPTPGEIPIFTNEFLEHNKVYDMELRSLRKSKTDLEQQNSVLEKHVENMKFGVEKMITENNELEEKNRLLEIYLDKLKRKLALALSALPLPTAPTGATVDNIDKYMQDLYKMSTSNSTGPATLNKAKDIIRKLDLQIQL